MERLIIGENIRRHRAFRNKKQDSLAREIGKTRQMLSRYENGKSAIPLAMLDLIAEKLGIPVTQLFETN
ncbi:MAG: Helix-turn-helix domain [Chitinophagaceae bacterium]|jgi:transcriptional regulator with XRE-family HTH domain|nr:Helix-turn-helix domain [Chitinophagaceae bacterium]